MNLEDLALEMDAFRITALSFAARIHLANAVPGTVGAPSGQRMCDMCCSGMVKGVCSNPACARGSKIGIMVALVDGERPSIRQGLAYQSKPMPLLFGAQRYAWVPAQA